MLHFWRTLSLVNKQDNLIKLFEATGLIKNFARFDKPKFLSNRKQTVFFSFKLLSDGV